MADLLRIALAGNPNSGKTSLFNALTGLRQHVGNFPGVTVDKKTGIITLKEKQTAELVDLPGTYSLYPRRVDEFIAFDVLINPDNESHPDAILLVVDASNLKRNLLFASQIIDLGKPVVIALNMLDVAKKNGMEIDSEKLSTELGVPVVEVNAREEKGIEKLRATLSDSNHSAPAAFSQVEKLSPDVIREVRKISRTGSSYAAFQVASHYQNIYCLSAQHKQEIKSVLDQYGFPAAKLQGEEILQRYDKIDRILKSTIHIRDSRQRATEITSRIDKWTLHPVSGFLIFLLIFFLVFQAIFSWANYPMDLIGTGFSQLGSSVSRLLPQGWVSDLITQGIIPGISGIAVFVPQIMLLFGFINLLEDSGYMARVSFLTDKIMRGFGLSGKSVVPLISGLACAVPAIMGARNIENKKSRLLTILVTPLMSCSARLPVYTLLVGMIVPDQPVLWIFNMKGMVMLGLYLLGFFTAILAALVIHIFVTIREKSYYLMELPLYRVPRWKNAGLTMIEKARVFVTSAGKIILAISVVLWALAAFGPKEEMAAVTKKYSDKNLSSIYSKEELNTKIQSEKLTHSYAGHLGKIIEPAIRPLGFDWKIGIALITSFAAREVFVGTMSTIYSVGSSDEPNYSLIREKMLADKNPETGKQVYSVATVISLMLFFAFAMQCMSTMAVVRRETGSWRWVAFQFFYMTGLAYLASFVTYQLMS